MIKMTDLKAAFEECGFENVVTYINSGNIAFDLWQRRSPGRVLSGQNPVRTKGTREVESAIAGTIEQAIEKNFAKQIPVMIREQAAIADILANNPFAGKFESHKEMHVIFLREEMPAEKLDQLLAAAPEGERYAVIGRELYCHLPKGVIESLLGKSFLEKKLNLTVTGRNWRTTEKLAVL